MHANHARFVFSSIGEVVTRRAASALRERKNLAANKYMKATPGASAHMCRNIDDNKTHSSGLYLRCNEKKAVSSLPLTVSFFYQRRHRQLYEVEDLFKKTMLIVGVLVAATITMSGTASASPHRQSHHHAARTGFRSPRVAFRGFRMRTTFARRGAHWRHLAGARPHLSRRYAGLSHRGTRVAAAPIASAASMGGGGQTGGASYYSGGRTAAGGRVGAATCAHRSLPFGTRVLVTNLANAHQAILTVNDRGPFVRGRIVDVSRIAAGVLGMLHSGTAPVRVQVVGGPG